VIFCDLEGASGVQDPSKISARCEQYEIFITEDVNAAIRGLRKGGAEKIYVVDTHGAGTNIRPDLLDKSAELIPPPMEMRKVLFCCPPRIPESMEKEMAAKVDAVVRLGAHARRQTRGFLAHTMVSYPPTRAWVNGMEIGETGLYVLWSGSHKIPVILFAGDDVAMEEAASLVPNARRITTKKSLSRSRCELVPPDTVRNSIEKEALEAVRRIKEIPPYRSPAVYRIEMSFGSKDHATACRMIPKVEVRNETVITYEAESFPEAKRFIDTTISVARLFETLELVSALRKSDKILETIGQWQNQRRKELGADWESE